MPISKPTRRASRLFILTAIALTGILPACSQTVTESLPHTFVNSPQGANPTTPVTRDAAGNLYGTTRYGGTNGTGVIYRLDRSGHVKVLYDVPATQQLANGVVVDLAGNIYGSFYSSGLVYKLDKAGNFTQVSTIFWPSPVTLDSAGNLYWTTNEDNFCSHEGCGGIFKFDTSGKLTQLYSFSEQNVVPTSPVTVDAAGNIYGTAGYSLYKLDASGHFTFLYTGSNTEDPRGQVVLDAKGNIYGTGVGPTASAGILYEFDASGSFKVLYTFAGGAPGVPLPSPVVLDAAGNLYGTAPGGLPGCGATCGVVYKFDTAGNYTALYSFTGGSDGGTPESPVTIDPSGNLQGTTYQGGTEGYGVVYQVTSAGQETVLYSFQADRGSGPANGLVGDSSGNLYGVTYAGGSANDGVVYKFSAGHYSVLHEFTGGADGGLPRAGVVLDSAGNIYGVTAVGGSAGFKYVGGVIFKLDPAGNETVLYNLTGAVSAPEAGVILDPQGNIYGIGGVSTVFKLDTSGNFTVLANIPGGAGGAYAYAGLVHDAAGNLYGTTTYGGDLSCNVGGGEPGCGVVYKVDTAGNYTVLHAFTGGSDGANPTYANLAIDAAGNLYGVTQFGGAGASCTYTASGCGIAFKIDLSGHETVLHRFKGTDGYQPRGVNVDPAGGVYGTTYQGGEFGCGDVFKINGSGQFTVLYSFTSTNGCSPNAGLVFDPGGAYFGTFNYYQDDPGIEQWTGGGIFKLKTQ